VKLGAFSSRITGSFLGIEKKIGAGLAGIRIGSTFAPAFNGRHLCKHRGERKKVVRGFVRIET
jgi:hypothetical protein